MRHGMYRLTLVQKKRKYGRDGPEENEKQPDENETLKDATTLYVGNLFVNERPRVGKGLTHLQVVLYH